MTDIGCLMCRGKTPPPGASCKTCGRRGERPAHLCHAIGCEKAVPLKMLFCLQHWRMTPREIQKRVWSEYRPGQEIDKKPTTAYLDVMKEAIAAVAERESRR